MNVYKFNNFTDSQCPCVIAPDIFRDERGYFFESFNERAFKEMVADVDFVQDNESRSQYGTIRGFHYQEGEHAQAKLVRVSKGSVIDVAVDIRKNSPAYGMHYSVYLSDKNHKQFYIPRGFAHGFVALEDDTVFQYKCDNYYNKESERGIHYLDTDINCPWFQWINPGDAIVSEKDKTNKLLSEIEPV